MSTGQLSVFSGCLGCNTGGCGTSGGDLTVEVGLGGVERPFVKQPSGSVPLPKAPGREGDLYEGTLPTPDAFSSRAFTARLPPAHCCQLLGGMGVDSGTQTVSFTSLWPVRRHAGPRVRKPSLALTTSWVTLGQFPSLTELPLPSVK